LIEVECRGCKFKVEVVWGNWPGRVHPDVALVPLRASEVGLDPSTPTHVLDRPPAASK
jgi:hypothetical protein